MLLKTLIVYIIIGALLIALLSTLLYYWFSSNSIREINKVSTDSLKQSMHTFDTLWESLYLYMNNEFNSNTVLKEGMERTQPFDPVDSKKIRIELDSIVATNTPIDSAYLYNSQADAVFSNFGTMTSCRDFFDQDIAGILNSRSADISQISDCAVIYRTMDFSYGSVAQNKNVITVIFSIDNMSTALVFNIDQSVLQNLIEPQDSGQSSQSFLIMNKQGLVVSDSDPDRIYTNIDGQDYGQKILGSAAQSGCFTDSVQGRKSLVTYCHWDKWDALGLIFVNVADYDKLIGGLRQLQSSILLITALFVMASLVTASLIFGNVFRPIFRLIELLRTRNPNVPAQTNEIAYLGNVYTNMASDLDSLNSFKNSSRPALKHELLNRLLRGEVSAAEDVSGQAGELSVRLDSPAFRVVVFRPDSAADVAPADLALLNLAACGIVSERFAPLCGEAVECVDGNISVIIGGDFAARKPEEAAREAQEACLKHLNLSLTVGIGTQEDGIAGIQYSYRNACEAAAYRLVYGRGAVVDFAAEAASRVRKYAYPIERERDLLEAVKSADSARFGAALDAFTASIQGFAYDEILLALSQMTLILIRTLKAQLQVSHMREAGIEADVREVDSVIRTSDTMEEIKRWLRDYFERCMEAVRLRKSNKYTEVTDSIQQYILENYCDSGLTVEMIADKVDLSPNYMRSIFKEHTGVTVSHYLNELRFNKAKELLAGTSFPASRIAGMAGFQEGSYFYSAFKNSTGVSPEEYRRVNRRA